MSTNANLTEAADRAGKLAQQLMGCLMTSGFDEIGRLLLVSALVTVLAEGALGGTPDGLHTELRGLLDAAVRFRMAVLNMAPDDDDSTQHKRGES